MHVEIHNPSVISAIERQAVKKHTSPDQIVEEALQEHLKRIIQPEWDDPFMEIREILLAEHGGKPFSDSAELIRESRDHDH